MKDKIVIDAGLYESLCQGLVERAMIQNGDDPACYSLDPYVMVEAAQGAYDNGAVSLAQNILDQAKSVVTPDNDPYEETSRKISRLYQKVDGMPEYEVGDVFYIEWQGEKGAFEIPAVQSGRNNDLYVIVAGAFPNLDPPTEHDEGLCPQVEASVPILEFHEVMNRADKIIHARNLDCELTPGDVFEFTHGGVTGTCQVVRIEGDDVYITGSCYDIYACDIVKYHGDGVKYQQDGKPYRDSVLVNRDAFVAGLWSMEKCRRLQIQ